MHKMNKKAAFTLLMREIIVLTLFLVFFGFFFFNSTVFANMLGTKDSDKKLVENLDNLIRDINGDMTTIKEIGPQEYSIDIDGTKYFIAVENCKDEIDDEGRCKSKPKTKLCLEKVDSERKLCSKKSLDYAFEDISYSIPEENIVVSWVKKDLKLSLASS